MATETEITTPVETADVDTSLETTPVQETDTVVDEQPVEETAVTETQAEAQDPQPTEEPVLLAGKYKSVDDLVEGYKNAEKFISKASEYEKKYNELLAKQQEEVQRLAQQKLEQAQLRGFKSAEEQEIADRVQVAEFEYYWGNINNLSPESAKEAEEYLRAYYQTANPTYLEGAKRFYPSDFVEKVALVKNDLSNKLNGELRQRKQKEYEATQAELANTLKADYAEFLADISSNKGKSSALQSFCNAGFINSKEDMQAFVDVYAQIAQFERDLLKKELEAQKAIEETKNKAVIGAGIDVASNGDNPPTYAQIQAMTQAEFDKACERWGVEKIINAK